MSVIPWLVLVVSLAITVVGAVGSRRHGPRLALIGAMYALFALSLLARNTSAVLSYGLLAASGVMMILLFAKIRTAWRWISPEVLLGCATILSIVAAELFGDSGPAIRLTLGFAVILFGVIFTVTICVRGFKMLRTASPPTSR